MRLRRCSAPPARSLSPRPWLGPRGLPQRLPWRSALCSAPTFGALDGPPCPRVCRNPRRASASAVVVTYHGSARSQMRQCPLQSPLAAPMCILLPSWERRGPTAHLLRDGESPGCGSVAGLWQFPYLGARGGVGGAAPGSKPFHPSGLCPRGDQRVSHSGGKVNHHQGGLCLGGGGCQNPPSPDRSGLSSLPYALERSPTETLPRTLMRHSQGPGIFHNTSHKGSF
ncbi:uncharacterized protein LOC123957917 [Micropterus dolomieu]|uniref:uncharacterized protein LOC123957917 n=1 Tax=Micropterus dolomieu TaxID=147949 RepID=UPI001E8CF0B4|nr:uncharacterized protein LOC123957917 [Micropterus dolomieu]